MSATDMELLLAVRKHYPDISKAPGDIQAAVEKAEKANQKLLGKDLHKASSAVDKASKDLRNLRDAKSQHREKWLQHLKDAVTSWELQLKQYAEQQQTYEALIKKVRIELDLARKTLATLNTQAADSHGTGTEAEFPPEAEEAHTDAEALQLQGQVQQI